MKIKVTYGVGSVCEQEFPPGTSFGCVINNPRVRAFHGYGNNVEGRVSGVPQSNDTPMYSDMTISVTDKACEKAG